LSAAQQQQQHMKIAMWFSSTVEETHGFHGCRLGTAARTGSECIPCAGTRCWLQIKQSHIIGCTCGVHLVLCLLSWCGCKPSNHWLAACVLQYLACCSVAGETVASALTWQASTAGGGAISTHWTVLLPLRLLCKVAARAAGQKVGWIAVWTHQPLLQVAAVNAAGTRRGDGGANAITTCLLLCMWLFHLDQLG
jgi:hypothetical protein